MNRNRRSCLSLVRKHSSDHVNNSQSLRLGIISSHREKETALFVLTSFRLKRKADRARFDHFQPPLNFTLPNCDTWERMIIISASVRPPSQIILHCWRGRRSQQPKASLHPFSPPRSLPSLHSLQNIPHKEGGVGRDGAGQREGAAPG